MAMSSDDVHVIDLENGEICICDKADSDKVNKYKWKALYRFNKNGGVVVSVATWVPRTYILMHRLIIDVADGEIIDHIDGNPLNNRRENLRIVTHAQNMKNRKRGVNNTSGFKGVSNRNDGSSNPWRAKIHVDGMKIELGSFKTAEMAYAAYCNAAIRLHGEFARLI